jgi:hypothetical protein
VQMMRPRWCELRHTFRYACWVWYGMDLPLGPRMLVCHRLQASPAAGR